jgi:F0F1-type ATP synthase membrane subunit b/b'
MNLILLLLMSFSLFVVSPPSSRASDQAQQTAAEPSRQKEEYEKSMQERLGNIGKRLDELRAKADAGAEDARKELKQLVNDAEKKREAASRKFEEVRKASSEKWKKFTSDMNKAADDFEKAYERARQRLKE